MYYILLPTGILRHHTVILHMHSIRRNQRPLFCTACSLKKLPLIKIFNTLQNHTHHLATPSRQHDHRDHVAGRDTLSATGWLAVHSQSAAAAARDCIWADHERGGSVDGYSWNEGRSFNIKSMSLCAPSGCSTTCTASTLGAQRAQKLLCMSVLLVLILKVAELLHSLHGLSWNSWSCWDTHL